MVIRTGPRAPRTAAISTHSPATAKLAAKRFLYDTDTRSLRPVIVDLSRKPAAKDLPLGATVWGKGVGFLLWAPKAKSVELVLDNGDVHSLTPDANGYVSTWLEGVKGGAKYGYRLDGAGMVMPDPASHRQPDGEMGLSEVVDHSFKWTDSKWKGRPLAEMDITEAHVGTLSKRRDLEGARKAVGKLAANTVELMPLHQFPGDRNWGYDPAQIFAVHNTYGTPHELKRLVDHAHREGKAVLLDAVYNHPGPQGAFSGAYGPYFEGASTPWGGGVNVEGPQCREVSRHFIENALMWLNEYRVDGLRLDATVYLPEPLLRELSEAVKQLERVNGRKYVMISENNRNNRMVTTPVDLGGHGFDGQWSMDLQYALRALLAGEKGWRIDRYTDAPFKWAMKAIAKGWAYEGEVSPYEKRAFGTPATGVPAEAIIVAKDDHDQIGNTPLGERLGNRIGPRLDRAVDALFGLLPFTVMNFQGDDYRAGQPFDFFVDVKDPLATQIREGRNREWVEWLGEGRQFRDPNAAQTFEGNQLDLADRKRSPHREAFALTSEIFGMREKHPALKRRDSATYEVVGFEQQKSCMQRRWTPEGDELLAVTNMSNEPVELDLSQGVLEQNGAGSTARRALSGRWKVILNTEATRFGGEGAGPKEGASFDFSASTRLTLPPGSALYLERHSLVP